MDPDYPHRYYTCTLHLDSVAISSSAGEPSPLFGQYLKRFNHLTCPPLFPPRLCASARRCVVGACVRACISARALVCVCTCGRVTVCAPTLVIPPPSTHRQYLHTRCLLFTSTPPPLPSLHFLSKPSPRQITPLLNLQISTSPFQRPSFCYQN